MIIFFIIFDSEILLKVKVMISSLLKIYNKKIKIFLFLFFINIFFFIFFFFFFNIYVVIKIIKISLR